MNFESYRIITNGVKYRLEGKYFNTRKETRPGEKFEREVRDTHWVQLAQLYQGISFGSGPGILSPQGTIFEFDTKEAARAYIKEEYGAVGVRALENEWYPVC